MNDPSDVRGLRHLAGIVLRLDKNRSYSDEDIAGVLRYWPAIAPEVAGLRHLSDDWKRVLVRDHPLAHQRLAQRNTLPDDVISALRRSTDPNVQSALSWRDEHAVRRGARRPGSLCIAEPGSDLDLRCKARERWLDASLSAILADASAEGVSIERHAPALESGPFAVSFDGSSVEGLVALWPVGVAHCTVVGDDGEVVSEWDLCVDDAPGLETLLKSVLALVLEARASSDPR